MQHPAKELFLWSQTDNQKFIEVIQKLTFTEHLFKLKVKEEMYNDEQQLKSTVVRVDHIDQVTESKLMIDLITKLNRGETIDVPISSGINGGRHSFGSTTQHSVTLIKKNSNSQHSCCHKLAISLMRPTRKQLELPHTPLLVWFKYKFITS